MSPSSITTMPRSRGLLTTLRRRRRLLVRLHRLIKVHLILHCSSQTRIRHEQTPTTCGLRIQKSSTVSLRTYHDHKHWGFHTVRSGTAAAGVVHDLLGSGHMGWAPGILGFSVLARHSQRAFLGSPGHMRQVPLRDTTGSAGPR
jgi:hypothetical protein